MSKKPISGPQVEVQIMGQSYTLACADGDEPELLAAVRKINATMCGIRDAGKIKARDRIAILAGIHLAHELIQRDAAPPPSPAAPDPDHAPDERLAALLERLDRTLGDKNEPA